MSMSVCWTHATNWLNALTSMVPMNVNVPSDFLVTEFHHAQSAHLTPAGLTMRILDLAPVTLLVQLFLADPLKWALNSTPIFSELRRIWRSNGPLRLLQFGMLIKVDTPSLLDSVHPPKESNSLLIKIMTSTYFIIYIIIYENLLISFVKVKEKIKKNI